MDGDAAGSVCVAGAGVSDDDGDDGVGGSPTPDLWPSSPGLHSVDTLHYTIVDYYRVWDFFVDAEQPWTAALRRRVPDDGSHSVFDGVIGSLLNGLPSWSTTLLYMDTWIATDYKLTGYTPWIYTVIVPMLFRTFTINCLTLFACLTSVAITR